MVGKRGKNIPRTPSPTKKVPAVINIPRVNLLDAFFIWLEPSPHCSWSFFLTITLLLTTHDSFISEPLRIPLDLGRYAKLGYTSGHVQVRTVVFTNSHLKARSMLLDGHKRGTHPVVRCPHGYTRSCGTSTLPPYPA